MYRLVTHTAAAAGLLVALSGSAAAEFTKDIAGTWTLVSNVIERPDGSKVQPFGPNPMGIFILDGSGHFTIMISRTDVPKFSANNREIGTAEENQAAVRGSIAYFGTYTANEPDRTITVKITGSTFPNWVGTEQKRQLTISGDEMQYVNPTPSVGSGSANIVWRRAK
jgi:hypothetical protein